MTGNMHDHHHSPQQATIATIAGCLDTCCWLSIDRVGPKMTKKDNVRSDSSVAAKLLLMQPSAGFLSLWLGRHTMRPVLHCSTLCLVVLTGFLSAS